MVKGISLGVNRRTSAMRGPALNCRTAMFDLTVPPTERWQASGPVLLDTTLSSVWLFFNYTQGVKGPCAFKTVFT